MLDIVRRPLVRTGTWIIRSGRFGNKTLCRAQGVLTITARRLAVQVDVREGVRAEVIAVHVRDHACTIYVQAETVHLDNVLVNQRGPGLCLCKQHDAVLGVAFDDIFAQLDASSRIEGHARDVLLHTAFKRGQCGTFDSLDAALTLADITVIKQSTGTAIMGIERVLLVVHELAQANGYLRLIAGFNA